MCKNESLTTDGGCVFAEQIPKDEWAKMMVIDARDPAQFARGPL